MRCTAARVGAATCGSGGVTVGGSTAATTGSCKRGPRSTVSSGSAVRWMLDAATTGRCQERVGFAASGAGRVASAPLSSADAELDSTDATSGSFDPNVGSFDPNVGSFDPNVGSADSEFGADDEATMRCSRRRTGTATLRCIVLARPAIVSSGPDSEMYRLRRRDDLRGQRSGRSGVGQVMSQWREHRRVVGRDHRRREIWRGRRHGGHDPLDRRHLLPAGRCRRSGRGGRRLGRGHSGPRTVPAATSVPSCHCPFWIRVLILAISAA